MISKFNFTILVFNYPMSFFSVQIASVALAFLQKILETGWAKFLSVHFVVFIPRSLGMYGQISTIAEILTIPVTLFSIIRSDVFLNQTCL